MTTRLKLVFVAVVLIGAGWGLYQFAAPPSDDLSKFVPAGPLLYLEAKDFGSLLQEWNASSQKQAWLKSDNYEVFSRSRVFGRLSDAQEQFAKAAGIPPNMKFLSEAAGGQSVLAWYDIGELEALYITRLPSASAMQTALWNKRGEFETRKSGKYTFYVRTDAESERTAAFAVTEEYLVLATREDLIADALALMSGNTGRTVRDERWYRDGVEAAGKQGDLRLVLNMEEIVTTPYFRSYWVQQNITDLSQYRAAVTDLYRNGAEYREERVLLRNDDKQHAPASDGAAVAELVATVPAETGFYCSMANPDPKSATAILLEKVLVPHLGPAPVQKYAPPAPSAGGEAGSASDLETRIDQAPQQLTTAAESTTAKVEQQLASTGLKAMIVVQSTKRDQDGVFVGIRSAVVLLASSQWKGEAIRAAIESAVRPGLTAAQFGVAWQPRQADNASWFELDGLQPLAVFAHGPYLLVSDDAELLGAIASKLGRKAVAEPATRIAAFNHELEGDNFARMMSIVDRPHAISTGQTFENGQVVREPQFFSGNIASVSRVLAGVKSETIIEHDSADRLKQTVTYVWAQ